MTNFEGKVLEELKKIDEMYVPHACKKVNGVVKTGFCRRKEVGVAPIYRVSKEDLEMDPAELAAKIHRSMQELESMAEEVNVGDLKRENVFFMLVNTKMNKDLVTELGCREFMDLAFVPRCLVQKDDEGVQSCIMSPQLMEQLNVDVERDFEMIKENTIRLFPLKKYKLKNVLGLDDSVDVGIWVITNEHGVNGAATAILAEGYKGIYDSAVVLPSSVHELLVAELKGGRVEAEEYNRMVKEVNETLLQEEVLSDHAYRYSSREGLRPYDSE